MTADAEIQGCRAMWNKGILQAFVDAGYRGKNSGLIVAADQAREWLTTPSRDLRYVCDLADIDVSSLLARAAELADQGWPVKDAIKSQTTEDVAE